MIAWPFVALLGLTVAGFVVSLWWFEREERRPKPLIVSVDVNPNDLGHSRHPRLSQHEKRGAKS